MQHAEILGSQSSRIPLFYCIDHWNSEQVTIFGWTQMSDVTDCQDLPKLQKGVKHARCSPSHMRKTNINASKCSLNSSMNMQSSAHLCGDGELGLTWEAGTRGEASIKLMTSGSAIGRKLQGPTLQFEYFLPKDAPPLLSWVEALFIMFFNPTAG